MAVTGLRTWLYIATVYSGLSYLENFLNYGELETFLCPRSRFKVFASLITGTETCLALNQLHTNTIQHRLSLSSGYSRSC